MGITIDKKNKREGGQIRVNDEAMTEATEVYENINQKHILDQSLLKFVYIEHPSSHTRNKSSNAFSSGTQKLPPSTLVEPTPVSVDYENQKSNETLILSLQSKNGLTTQVNQIKSLQKRKNNNDLTKDVNLQPIIKLTNQEVPNQIKENSSNAEIDLSRFVKMHKIQSHKYMHKQFKRSFPANVKIRRPSAAQNYFVSQPLETLQKSKQMLSQNQKTQLENQLKQTDSATIDFYASLPDQNRFREEFASECGSDQCLNRFLQAQSYQFLRKQRLRAISQIKHRLSPEKEVKNQFESIQKSANLLVSLPYQQVQDTSQIYFTRTETAKTGTVFNTCKQSQKNNIILKPDWVQVKIGNSNFDSVSSPQVISGRNSSSISRNQDRNHQSLQKHALSITKASEIPHNQHSPTKSRFNEEKKKVVRRTVQEKIDYIRKIQTNSQISQAKIKQRSEKLRLERNLNLLKNKNHLQTKKHEPEIYPFQIQQVSILHGRPKSKLHGLQKTKDMAISGKVEENAYSDGLGSKQETYSALVNAQNKKTELNLIPSVQRIKQEFALIQNQIGMSFENFIDEQTYIVEGQNQFHANSNQSDHKSSPQISQKAISSSLSKQTKQLQILSLIDVQKKFGLQNVSDSIETQLQSIQRKNLTSRRSEKEVYEMIREQGHSIEALNKMRSSYHALAKKNEIISKPAFEIYTNLQSEDQKSRSMLKNQIQENIQEAASHFETAGRQTLMLGDKDYVDGLKNILQNRVMITQRQKQSATPSSAVFNMQETERIVSSSHNKSYSASNINFKSNSPQNDKKNEQAFLLPPRAQEWGTRNISIQNPQSSILIKTKSKSPVTNTRKNQGNCTSSPKIQVHAQDIVISEQTLKILVKPNTKPQEEIIQTCTGSSFDQRKITSCNSRNQKQLQGNEMTFAQKSEERVKQKNEQKMSEISHQTGRQDIQLFYNLINQNQYCAGAIRQLVDQEHKMMQNQSYCGYQKTREKFEQTRQQELNNLLSQLRKHKSQKWRQKLWQQHEFQRPSNIVAFKAAVQHTQLRGDVFLQNNLIQRNSHTQNKTLDQTFYIKQTEDSIESFCQQQSKLKQKGLKMIPQKTSTLIQIPRQDMQNQQLIIDQNEHISSPKNQQKLSVYNKKEYLEISILGTQQALQIKHRNTPQEEKRHSQLRSKPQGTFDGPGEQKISNMLAMSKVKQKNNERSNAPFSPMSKDVAQSELRSQVNSTVVDKTGTPKSIESNKQKSKHQLQSNNADQIKQQFAFVKKKNQVLKDFRYDYDDSLSDDLNNKNTRELPESQLIKRDNSEDDSFGKPETRMGESSASPMKPIEKNHD